MGHVRYPGEDGDTCTYVFARQIDGGFCVKPDLKVKDERVNKEYDFSDDNEVLYHVRSYINLVDLEHPVIEPERYARMRKKFTIKLK